MNRLRNITTLLLLVIITVCIVLLPQRFDEKREDNLLKGTSFRNLSIRNSVKITRHDVAQLYNQRMIYIEAFAYTPVTSENNDIEQIRRDSAEIFSEVFGNESKFTVRLNKILENETMKNSFQKVEIIMFDNHPLALNIYLIQIPYADFTLQYIYEQKTKTLLNFCFFNFNYDNTFSIEKNIGEIEECAKKYIKEKLGMSESQSYIHFETANYEDSPYGFIEFGVVNSS